MNNHVKNTVNLSSQATPIANIENDLQNWSIPEESFNAIYQTGICLVNDFVISEDIIEDIILGIPFVNQIRPYKSDYDGIRSVLLGTELFFPLLRPLSKYDGQRIKEETVFKINRLSSHITFLKQEVQLKHIEQTLKTPEMVDKISSCL